MRFVSGELLMTKGFAGRVEDHGQVVGLIIRQQPTQHIQHSVQRAGGFAGLRTQRRQRVKRPVEPGGTVNQQYGFGLRHQIHLCLERNIRRLLFQLGRAQYDLQLPKYR